MKTLVMAMTPDRAKDVCDEETKRLLEQNFTLRWASESLDADELTKLLPGSDVLITSWGTPNLPTELLLAENGPKIIGHAAGSIKKLVDAPALTAGVTVFSAAGRIANSVGEYCLTVALNGLRRINQFDARMRANEWKSTTFRGSELSNAQVGIVGASSTARAFISLLAPFDCDIVVYDPYLDASGAQELGVRRGSLEEVASSKVVSLHVPNVPATEGMFTASLIEMLRPGTVFINSSRSPAVDTAALNEAVLSGKIVACLDVFDSEPPALSAQFLAASNTVLSPHIAGDTTEGHLALTGYVLRDILAFIDSGHRGKSYVNPAILATSA